MTHNIIMDEMQDSLNARTRAIQSIVEASTSRHIKVFINWMNMTFNHK